jgi:hypothetical protein
MKPLALLAVLLAIASPAAAIEPVSFGEIGYGGTGCPAGTATIVTNDARTSASLSLSAYTVGDGNRPLDRKTCALAIPVIVPDGVAVAIRGVSVIGHVELPEGVEATFTLEAFVAGDEGEVTDLSLGGPRSGSWQRTISVPWDKLVWTGCGEDTNLRINTSLRTRGNANAEVSIDTLTLYRFPTKTC